MSARDAVGALPPVAIVSVTYNRCDALLVLLAQLRTLDYPADRLAIFVVDNASADDTVARVRADFPEVRLTESAENLGTSAGFNVGMRQALAAPEGFEHVWLLDSDAEVEPGTLLPLVEALRDDERLGIVGSAIYDPSDRGRLVTTGLRVDWPHGKVALNKSAGTVPLVEADLVAACSLLVRASLCREMGLWDERFWVYWGDTDWCLRAIGRGYRVCGHARSRAWHRDWANTAQNFRAPSVLYDDVRGGLLFNLRHAPEGSLRGSRHLLLKAYFKAALENFTARPNFAVALDRAVEDFLAGRFELRRYEPPLPPALDVGELLATLRSDLPARPRVIIDRIGEGPLLAKVEGAFARHCPDATFERIAPRNKASRDDFTTDYGHFIRADVPQVLRRLFRRRADVIVSEIAVPHLYTLFAARRVILLDRDGRGVVRANAVGRGLAGFATTLARGVKQAFWKLPHAARRNARLREAVVNAASALPGAEK
jgi:GT2 family glycosyltransferase